MRITKPVIRLEFQCTHKGDEQAFRKAVDPIRKQIPNLRVNSGRGRHMYLIAQWLSTDDEPVKDQIVELIYQATKSHLSCNPCVLWTTMSEVQP